MQRRRRQSDEVGDKRPIPPVDIFQQLYSLPVWIVAGSVTLIATVVFAVFLCALLAVASEQQRREDMLEREPWRRHVRPERRFDPDPR